MSLTQALLAALIGLCGVLMALNWASLIQAHIQGKGFSFAPPWLCGLVASGAMFFYPGGMLKDWAWLPWLADPSLAFCLLLAGQKWRKRDG